MQNGYNSVVNGMGKIVVRPGIRLLRRPVKNGNSNGTFKTEAKEGSCHFLV